MNVKACWCIAMLLCVPAVAEAKMEIGDGPPGNVTALEIWADQKAKNKQVVTPYADFLVMVSKVEHSEKLKNKAMAENGVLLKLKDEQGTIIKVQADQIKACEASCELLIDEHKKVLADALAALDEATKESWIEKGVYLGTGFALGVAARTAWVKWVRR